VASIVARNCARLSATSVAKGSSGIAARPYSLLFATISGVRLYGFPSPDSDYDLREEHVFPLDAVVGLEVRDETVEDLGVCRQNGLHH
jgi:hypothetical protein